MAYPRLVVSVLSSLMCRSSIFFKKFDTLICSVLYLGMGPLVYLIDNLGLWLMAVVLFFFA